MSDSLHRRGFFNPRRLLRVVTDLQSGLEQSIKQIEDAVAVPVVTFRHQAMACSFEIQLGNPRDDRRPFIDGFALIDGLESQLSVYRDDSEVSRLNSRAAYVPVVVEERLFGLLVRCRQLHDESGRAFDITAGPLIRAWGFKRRQGRVPDQAEIDEMLRRLGMKNVLLDPVGKTVRFAVPGMELNFGGIGKGYAVDRLTEQLTPASSAFLLSGGHSSLVARGRPTWDDAWRVAVVHPWKLDVTLATVALHDQALSTSGLLEQSFVVGGRRYGHLIDPRTGYPAEGLSQATALAPDATTAEALSTAFFINGVEWTKRYCDAHPGIGAFLVEETSDAAGDAPLATHLIGQISVTRGKG